MPIPFIKSAPSLQFSSCFWPMSSTPEIITIMQMKKGSSKTSNTSPQVSEIYDQVTRLQTEVETRVQKLKRQQVKQICEHLLLHTSEPQPYDPSVNYYDLCWKRFVLNQVSKKKLEEVTKENRHFAKKLNKIQNLFEQRRETIELFSQASADPKSSISSFVCLACSKSFLKQSNLDTHRRNKHQQQLEVKRECSLSPQENESA